MPTYAFLQAELRCPHCETLEGDLVWFQWGYCRSSIPRGDFYHLSDPIRWRKCSDGSVPAWTYFNANEGNVGDPAIQDLIARDTFQFPWVDWGLERPPGRRKCRSCHQPLEGAAIEIRKGIITRAWIYLPGELDNTADIYLIMPDGSYKPMQEWDDHPMPFKTDC